MKTHEYLNCDNVKIKGALTRDMLFVLFFGAQAFVLKQKKRDFFISRTVKNIIIMSFS